VLVAFALPTAANAAGGRLFHDSFSNTYRSPGGAVATGTSVTLRLRVTGKARTAALKLVVADPATDTSKQVTRSMTRKGSFWSVTYQAPAKPALVSYSFRVTTKRGTLWYGDDDSGSDIRKGGTGTTTRFRGDSFRLTVYDRAFTTPAWLQGAVVYEIFADRFRNGAPGNDYCRPPSGCPTFYGNIPASPHLNWNEPIELFPWLMIGLLFLLAVENLLANRFYRNEPAGQT